MNVQSIVMLHEIVQDLNPTTSQLLAECEMQGMRISEHELAAHALSAGIGLLNDGQWYTFEQSSMVDESRKHNHITAQTEKELQ
jgi:hypothetical protein